MLVTLSRIFKKKYFIFLMIVLFAFSLFGEFYHYFILSNIKSMKITLNYSGAAGCSRRFGEKAHGLC